MPLTLDNNKQLKTLDLDCIYIPYSNTGSFSELAIHYSEEKESLKNFYQYAPNIKGLQQAVADRKTKQVNRQLLNTVLKEQYQQLPQTNAVAKNIEALLQDNCFTICTAHQPNLMSGYLYFFYKILHAIKLAEELNQQQPENKFVPVYYMGSEDNDLDELGQFWFEGQKYTWQAAGQQGAVGRMSTESLKPLIAELFKKLGPPGPNADELKEIIVQSYLQHQTISEATAYLVNQLFGHYGLIVINPDNAALKKQFLPILKDELLHQNAYPIVQKQSGLLSQQYKAQAFPRAINLFYLVDGIRERIEKQDDYWQVINTNLRFTKEEILEELNQHPERFSPNVILRGLFQETILPNICFVGGGAELAYWLQLKPLFEHYNVFYPVVFLRQSVQILNEKSMQLLHQLSLQVADIFKSKETLLRELIVRNSGQSWSLEVQQKQIEQSLALISQQATNIDPNLTYSTAAVLAKINKQLKVLEGKMYRAEKKKEQTNAQRINHLKSITHPNNHLQEREENFMPYYLQHGFAIFDFIKSKIDPLSQQFLIVTPNQLSQ